MKLKLSLIFLAIAGISYYFYSQGHTPQIQSYHNFADRRMLFGVPNALDVLTNIFFIFVGYLGVQEITKRQKDLDTKKSWFWFFVSILLIGPGSAYYHWEPNDTTLIWDRLPMSMGFMAMYVALVSEHVSMKFEKTIYPALVLGLVSVITWVVTADLRFYYIVQFSSFITVPLILILFPSRYTLKIYYSLALGLYAVAKVVEVNDHEIFEGTRHLISGHSLKHICAATGLLLLWKMIHTRKLR